jgi:Tfp pilus assembly protein PilF
MPDGHSEGAPPGMSERVRSLLLLTMSAVVYGNTLLNGFTLDDDAYILHNPAVTGFSIRGLLQPTLHNNVFRPTAFATFALNWAIGENRPFGYHLINLLLHAGVTFLLYRVLAKLLEAMPEGRIVAWTTALVFAVHPIHTEAVASISGRSEPLAAGFLLAAWFLHLTDLPIPALTCFVLSLFSKESAVVFAPLVLAGDYVRDKLKPIHRYASVAGVTVVYLVLLWKVQGGRFGEQRISLLDNPLAHLTASLRVFNALRVAWKYIGLQIYPAKLSCDYSYNAILLDSNWRNTILAALCAAIVLALWIWALLTRRRAWFLAGAIYLLGFAVVGNILVPTGTILGERLMYLPSVGLCLLFVLLWIPLLQYNPRVAWVIIAAIMLLLSTRTVIRNQDWRDNFTLFTADVQAVPRSAKLHAMLGGQYMLRSQWDVAQREFETALQIYPDYPEVMELRAVIESRMGQDQEALRSLRRALSLSEKGSVSYDLIAINLANQFLKVGASDNALELMNELIEYSPAYSPAWSNRAAIRWDRGELALARADATTALHLDPTNTQAQYLLNLLDGKPPMRSK